MILLLSYQRMKNSIPVGKSVRGLFKRNIIAADGLNKKTRTDYIDPGFPFLSTDLRRAPVHENTIRDSGRSSDSPTLPSGLPIPTIGTVAHKG